MPIRDLPTRSVRRADHVLRAMIASGDPDIDSLSDDEYDRLRWLKRQSMNPPSKTAVKQATLARNVSSANVEPLLVRKGALKSDKQVMDHEWALKRRQERAREILDRELQAGTQTKAMGGVK